MHDASPKSRSNHDDETFRERGPRHDRERSENTPEDPGSVRERDPGQALVYRWFVQYNPLYLISAAAVLVGVYLISDALTTREGVIAQLAVFGIAEIYQFALIGAAALLYRLGQRRPATMLAMLTVVYLADLTLQTSVSPYLGVVGVVATVAWFVLTGLKLWLLTRALRLHVSWTTYALLMLGALGLAVFPHVLASRELSPTAATMSVGAWIFALGLVAIVSRRQVLSRRALDPWGQRVLHLATRAAWVLWAILAFGHSLWWAAEYELMPIFWVFSVVPLWGVVVLRRERGALGLVFATVAAALIFLPSAMLSVVFAMAAASLALRGLRGPRVRRLSDPAAQVSVNPYRVIEGRQMPPPEIFEHPSPWRLEARRLYVGALTCLYLAIWTAGWQGGPWPLHHLGLDLLFAIPLVIVTWRWRSLSGGLALGTMVSHWLLQAGWISAPTSTGELGVVVLVSGFLLLGVGVLINALGRPALHRPKGDPRRAVTSDRL